VVTNESITGHTSKRFTVVLRPAQFCSKHCTQQLHLANVLDVSDGLDAVQKVQKLQPDLILLDIGLPRLHGIDAAHQIRSVAPNAKILFLTENCDPNPAEAALRTGGGARVNDCGRSAYGRQTIC
jgi:DNA-binding NarL/FixJ family response regulator